MSIRSVVALMLPVFFVGLSAHAIPKPQPLLEYEYKPSSFTAPSQAEEAQILCEVWADKVVMTKTTSKSKETTIRSFPFNAEYIERQISSASKHSDIENTPGVADAPTIEHRANLFIPAPSGMLGGRYEVVELQVWGNDTANYRNKAPAAQNLVAVLNAVCPK